MALESQNEEWIMEGSYNPTLEYRIPRADLTIHLDYPRHVYFPRIVKRRIQHQNKHRQEMPDDWQERFKPEFLKFVWDYAGKKRSKLQAELEKYPEATIYTFHNPKQTKKYLNSKINDTY